MRATTTTTTTTQPRRCGGIGASWCAASCGRFPCMAGRRRSGIHIGWMLARVKRHLGEDARGMVERVSKDPFDVLVATLLSLRTKDETTGPAAERLLEAAPDPAALAAMPAKRIERLIFPVGFYHRKAMQLRAICRILVERHGGRVPGDMDALLALPGVGRKTANLVLSVGYGIPAICVDTHVHRITNRWGYVSTRHPDETEAALRAKLPRRHWLTINRLLVLFGKSVCRPVSPRCSTCPLSARCPRIGVARSGQGFGAHDAVDATGAAV